MVAFTFVVKKEGKSWSAQRVKDEEGPELTAEADDTYRCDNEEQEAVNSHVYRQPRDTRSLGRWQINPEIAQCSEDLVSQVAVLLPTMFSSILEISKDSKIVMIMRVSVSAVLRIVRDFIPEFGVSASPKHAHVMLH